MSVKHICICDRCKKEIEGKHAIAVIVYKTTEHEESLWNPVQELHFCGKCAPVAERCVEIMCLEE